jgi:hypothetical protein
VTNASNSASQTSTRCPTANDTKLQSGYHRYFDRHGFHDEEGRKGAEPLHVVNKYFEVIYKNLSSPGISAGFMDLKQKRNTCFV